MNGAAVLPPVAPGWDCHVHVFDETAPAAPRHYQAAHRPLEDIEALAATQGLGHLVLVQPSVYGNDHRVMLQALRQRPGRHAGVAVVDAIRAVAGAHPPPGLRLKWPNDVLIGGAKCAGILAESQQGGADAVVVVVGIGINLSSHPDALGRPATHLAAHGLDVTPDAMLASLAESMDGWMRRWDLGLGFDAVREAWLERAGPVGEPITVNAGAGPLAGAFMGLEAGGALLMRDSEGQVRTITFGDVSLGGPQGGNA